MSSSTLSKFEKGKGRGRSKTNAAADATSDSKRAEKEYPLTGQKFDTPDERDPLRIFYESLSKQIPSSEMAQFWLTEHGLLPPDRAKRAYEEKQKRRRRQQQTRSRSGTTPVKPTATANVTAKHKTDREQPEETSQQHKTRRTPSQNPRGGPNKVTTTSAMTSS